MPLNDPLNQDPTIWLDHVIEVRYRAPRGIKYQQISYTTNSGISNNKGVLIFIPAKFTINGATIKELRCMGGTWRTDAESDNKLVKVEILNGKQVHHQTALRQVGLPKNVREIIGATFTFQDSIGNVMSGTISSVNFVAENGKKLIQLSPRNNVAMNHVSKQYQRISYFQMNYDGSSTAYHRKSDLSSGIIKIQ